MGFEPMIPAFERAKTVHVIDSAATVIDGVEVYRHEFLTSIVDKGE
jgi:hypothetical protein